MYYILINIIQGRRQPLYGHIIQKQSSLVQKNIKR